MLKTYMKAIRESDAEMLAGPVHRAIEDAEAQLLEEHPDLPRHVIHDAAVIAGIAAVMLTLKWFKTMPGLPFAPGHKNAVLLPLYLLGNELCTTRFGATGCGVTMGVLAFLTGEGRYGVFEIFKHVAPGFLVDVLHPLVRPFGRTIWVYIPFGIVLAAGRLATELGVAFLLGVPKAFYAAIGGVSVTHLIAGGLSGFVSATLLGVVDGWRDGWNPASNTNNPQGGVPESGGGSGTGGRKDGSRDGRLPASHDEGVQSNAENAPEAAEREE
jgi:hypothetical protein